MTFLIKPVSVVFAETGPEWIADEPIAPSQRPASLTENLDWEPVAPRDGIEKSFLRYDESLNRLRAAGYDRHPSPSEAFSLIIAGIEDKLDEQRRVIAKDMLSNYGEWFNIAMEVMEQKTCHNNPSGKSLIIYHNPVLRWEGVFFDLNGYVEKKTYDITRVPSETWVELGHLPSELVVDLCGRPLKELPPQLKRGHTRVRLWLPKPGELWPASRNSSDWTDIITNVSHRASRGVREKSSFGTGGSCR